MKPRLLVLTPRFPYPVIGGDRLRIFRLCHALSEGYELTLLSLCQSKFELDYPLIDDGVFRRVERFLLPTWRSWINCLFALPSDLPLQVAYYRHSGFRRRALQLMEEHQGTLAHLIRVGDVIKDASGVKFLEMTDAISLNYKRLKKARTIGFDFRAFIYAKEADRLHAYEKSIVKLFDHSFLVSEVDRAHLFGKAGSISRVSVVSNGVDVESMPYQFNASAKDIVFIGNISSLQNFDAAMYMATVILPLVRRERPDVRLRLIGRIDSRKINQFRSVDGVDVLGEVSCIATAARNGAVGVCPLRIGAGVQNKVLEYMALGLPVVTTSIGLEGFGARPGKELIVADGSHSFAEGVLELINRREFAAQMAETARRFVEYNHTWERTLLPLIRTIDTHLGKGEN
jgi:glycosyltransferase involved in cell wall biosynthesis